MGPFMPLTITCAHCGKSLKAADELVGKVVHCPSCKETTLVPSMETGVKPGEAVILAEEIREDRQPRRDYDRRKSARLIDCPECGHRISPRAKDCPKCGFPINPEKHLGDDAGMRLLLPVGRSGWAIASGYLGLISILLFPAPLALITGIIAIFDIRRDSKKHGMGRAVFGIILGGLGSVGLAILTYAFLTGQLDRRAPNAGENKQKDPQPKSNTLTDPENRFTVDMPAEPFLEDRRPGRRSYSTRAKGMVFCYSYVTISQEELPRATPQQRIEAARDQMAKGLGQFVLESDKPIKFDKYEGREVEIRVGVPQGRRVAKLLMIENRVITLMVDGPDVTAETPDVVRFFQSFKLIEKR